MKFLQRLYIWDKMQWQKPETRMGVGIALGVVLGIALDNVGAGIGIGVAFGATGYAAQQTKLRKETKENESTE